MMKISNLPPHPTSINKPRFLITVPDGYRYRFTVTDEILRPQTGAPEKLLCLQRIKFEDNKEEIRLGYYIIGKKPKMRGKWVWGCGQWRTKSVDFLTFHKSLPAKGAIT